MTIELATQALTEGNLDLAVRRASDLLFADQTNAAAYNIIGAVCMQTFKFDKAAKLFDKAIFCDPDNARYHANSCAALRELGELEASEDAGDRSIALAPNNVGVLLNLALTNTLAGQHKLAQRLMMRCVALEPDNAAAHFALGNNLLLLNEWDAGWREYAWNHKRPNTFPTFPCLPTPLWNGMHLDGAMVVVCDEGFGDAIQYARYLRDARTQCRRLILVGPPELSVLQRVRGVDEYHTILDPELPHDAHTPISALPGICEDAARTDAYLVPDIHHVAKVRQDIPALSSWMNVGLFWRGRPTPRNRSVPFDQLVEELPAGPRYVALQPDVTDEERALLPTMVCPPLTSFADTAAVAFDLDRVITIDSAVAHLCGAMGVDTTVMLSRNFDWRWGVSGGHSRWYHRVAAIQQAKLGDWSDVLQQVREIIR